MLETPPLALYLHFPWCVRKCPYCDFNSYTLNGALPEAEYLAALARDMRAQALAPQVSGRTLTSIFMGGGTPSLFSPAAIGQVLEQARTLFGFTPDIEITLEANPGTIERGRFAEYAAVGVNRVSLGAQSFGAKQLQVLGRIHSVADTARGAEELHAAGISNFNVDLMYGLPEQDIAGARSDLRQALALAPAHISHYHLTMEPGTVFGAQPPPLPSEDSVEAMLEACAEELAGARLGHYEVSAYARAGRQCRHNLNYWCFGDYLGVGAGAHGKLTDAATATIVRTTQTRDPRRYQAGVPMASRTVPAAELPFEFMMNALRLTHGFDTGGFERRTGLRFEVVAPTLVRQRERGLLRELDGRWAPTPTGLRFLNDLLLEFLPERPDVVDSPLSRP
ncbi:MAG TPA: radical SAM family heme chaperone HemW [Steroidobacteraceae bacterium]|jgi:oxygen-independent coproporphyrinogen-3 oxidase|nr:radical SAM family heme chaperone HemW [Steroidobacteraceae bacterium]